MRHFPIPVWIAVLATGSWHNPATAQTSWRGLIYRKFNISLSEGLLERISRGSALHAISRGASVARVSHSYGGKGDSATVVRERLVAGGGQISG